nr:uncharacterized protein LOC109160061 [Ipomoea batatas]
MAHFSGGQWGTKRRMVGVALFLLCFYGGLISLSCAARLTAARKHSELKKHLKRLNKAPVKTIESPDGDIIDCVHISKQRAFDHPFLKDHEIQMRPSFHPEGLYDVNKESTGPKERTNPITQLWHMNGRCPEDTIPVRRTKEDDVLRASSVKRYGKKKHSSLAKPRGTDPDLVNESRDGNVPRPRRGSPSPSGTGAGMGKIFGDRGRGRGIC